MKTMLRITLVFAFVAIANMLFAVGNLKLNMVALKNEKAFVDISALSNSSFSISITDACGNRIYYLENVDSDGDFRKVFNFSKLEDGTFSMKVVSNDLTTERQFQKKRGVISIGNEITTLEPYFGYDNNLLIYSYLNFTKEDVSFSLYNKNNDIIHHKRIGNDFNVQQILNLSKLEKGSYQAILTAGNKTFNYALKIN